MIAGSIPAWSILLNTIGPEIELNVCAWDLQLSGPHSFNNFFNVVILARKAYHRPKPITSVLKFCFKSLSLVFVNGHD
jgi:hypothetical protein